MKKDKLKIIIPITIIIIAIVAIIIIFISKDYSKKTETKIEGTELSNLTYIPNKTSLISEQKELEEKYLKEYDSKKNTIDNPYIVTNPYQNSSLSALIMFSTESKTSGEIIIKGKGTAKDLKFNFDESKEHFITIWGLYENYNNEITIKTSSGEEKSLNIDLTYGDISNEEEQSFIEVEKNLNKINDFILLDTPIGTSITLMDTEGNIRGYLENGISKLIKQLDNGHILVSNGITNREGTASGIIEIDFSGKIYNYYNLDINMSYGSTVLDNGNILYMAQNQNGLETFDTIVEINKKGELVRIIDVYELMKKIDNDYIESIKDKWGYISGIDYNKENNEILISLWYSSTVMGIDYKDGNINWIFSDPQNLSDKFTNYLLKPTTDDFIYPKGAYSIKSNENGFSIFVTNWDMSESLLCINAKNKNSYFATYMVNRDAKSISENWSFGKDMNYYSYALGSYNEENNYKTMLFGRELNNINYDEEGCMLNSYWDLYSKLFITESDEIIFEAKIYGANAIANLYNITDKINNKFIEAKQYNFNYESEDFTKIKYDEYKEKIDNAVVNNYSFSFKENILSIIPTTENINLVLVSLDKDVYKYSLVDYNGEEVFKLNSYNKYFKVYIESDGELFNTETYLYF